MVYLTIRYGLRPKPIPIINPSVFSTPEEIGKATYHALRSAIRAEKVVVFGSTSLIPQYPQVWDGLVRAALDDHVRIDVVFARSDLGLPPSAVGLHLQQVSPESLSTSEFLKDVTSAYHRGQLALLYLMNLESSHLMKDSVTRKLQELPNSPIVAISMLPFGVRSEDVDQMNTQCLDPRDQDDGEQRLACAVARISRRYLRKKLPQDKWVGAVESHGLKEYLLFVSAPK